MKEKEVMAKDTTSHEINNVSDAKMIGDHMKIKNQGICQMTSTGEEETHDQEVLIETTTKIIDTIDNIEVLIT